MAALAISLLSVGGAVIPAIAQEVAPDRAPAGHPYAVHVAEAARRFGIPEAWIWAVMRVESNGNSRAVSPAGAIGLMQVILHEINAPGSWEIAESELDDFAGLQGVREPVNPIRDRSF